MENDTNLVNQLFELLSNGVLTAREFCVIKERYFGGKTLEQVGKELNVTRERVRQIESKAIMKLQHYYVSQKKKEIDQELENYKQERKEQIDVELARDNTYIEVVDIPIENLDFTARTYHCLKRTHINTISELCNKCEEDLRKIRNLGRKSYYEIVNKLAERDLKLKTNEERWEEENDY